MGISHYSPVSADLVSFKARGQPFLLVPAHQHAESVCIEQSLVVATSVCVGFTLVDPRTGVKNSPGSESLATPLLAK